MQEDLFLTPTEVELLAEPESLEPEAVGLEPEAVEAPQEAVEAPVAPEPVPTPVEPPLAAQALAAIAQIDALRDTLADKYEAGEISFKEFRAQERALERQQREAEGVVQQAQLHDQMLHTQSLRDWDNAVAEFRKDAGNAVFESPVTLPLMQSALNAIRSRTPGLSSAEQLLQAKTMVQGQMRALMGLDVLPAPHPVASRKLPPSLGVVPVAYANESDIEFAHLDKLAGLPLEKAIARMTADQRERWLNAA